jgi:hypothetical protein
MAMDQTVATFAKGDWLSFWHLNFSDQEVQYLASRDDGFVESVLVKQHKHVHYRQRVSLSADFSHELRRHADKACDLIDRKRDGKACVSLSIQCRDRGLRVRPETS